MKSPKTYSRTICIPAHNESKTIYSVVRALQEAIDSRSDFDCDVMVVDDRSSDQTGMIAAETGATVVSTESLCRKFGGSSGKGDAIYASLVSCRTDLMAWVDGDLAQMDAERVLHMFDPLEKDSRIQLVKGSFQRLSN